MKRYKRLCSNMALLSGRKSSAVQHVCAPATGPDHQWPQADEEQKNCKFPLAQFVEGDGGHMP